MLILIAASTAALDATNTTKAAAICAVGHIALRDLPDINHNIRFDAYYAATDPLLKVCPKLKKEIPAAYPLADDDARARASVHAPKPGQTIRPAAIYSIGLPQISDDLRIATVKMEYSCTGLCGASYIARYVRTKKGWRRDGDFRVIAVS